jgi:hypothetical protein
MQIAAQRRRVTLKAARLGEGKPDRKEHHGERNAKSQPQFHIALRTLIIASSLDHDPARLNRIPI